MALTNGLVVMTPSSVVAAGTGSSASINADGSVDFASCTSLSLNGVFTSSYDNYMIAIRLTSTSGSNTNNLWYRLRASGTDNSTSSSYTSQSLIGSSSTVSASRASNAQAVAQLQRNTLRSGLAIYLFGPQLAQPTAMRSISSSSTGDAQITDYAVTHNQSSSYDGISFIDQGGWAISGLLTVFGFNQ